ncbi:hypothetical protein PPL_12009 [Heterostelium album PN500]|uniref:Uncharacterized protein n=1 Tax=Heterostelium pallidum (strain ATCC 26659 / Pp 5 / PN500) TaxID=670386 RepID=D3BV37_HETP5|nr:hypothetical protein PPL_12009 [Heterostelium album PN500]EFA74975.1 hypothetical protein PPL_12009 [Heterostelium album PN500]|eukprot:XP_020427109.1 hypothetical protein PPL_12009 [Heterostelium album PN500]
MTKKLIRDNIDTIIFSLVCKRFYQNRDTLIQWQLTKNNAYKYLEDKHFQHFHLNSFKSILLKSLDLYYIDNSFNDNENNEINSNINSLAFSGGFTGQLVRSMFPDCITTFGDTSNVWRKVQSDPRGRCAPVQSEVLGIRNGL